MSLFQFMNDHPWWTAIYLSIICITVADIVKYWKDDGHDE
jgi:hypothetical protein